MDYKYKQQKYIQKLGNLVGGSKDGIYLIFAGDMYYPNGGWHDFYASYNNEDEAIREFKRIKKFYRYGWVHLVDFNKEKIIEDTWPEAGLKYD